jgi:hypothetical protein
MLTGHCISETSVARYKPASTLWVSLTMLLVSLGALPANGQEIHSIQVDRDLEKIIVKGSDLNLVSSVTLGGVTVIPGAPVAPTLMEIPFSNEIYLAVQWAASYNLVLDGSPRLSVYIDGAINAPPGPPVGGLECACIPGWEANASLIADKWAYCQPIYDGNQVGYVGSSTTAVYPSPTPWMAAAVFDFDNPTAFDYGDPGAARSFCVLDVDIDGIYEVAEPVTNIDQYDDCVNWLFKEGVCL